MASPIDFYFDFSSPYGYLAAQRIEDLAARHRRTVAWRPFLLGVAMKTTGAEPLLRVPMKKDYAQRDIQRSARRIDVPFRLPSPFPFAAVAASRAFYWLSDRNGEAGKDLARSLFHAAFGEGRDVSGAEAVADLAASLGHDRGEVADALQDPEVKARLRNETDRALAAGVFGSPFILVDGEPFWGFDRLPDVDAWLSTDGW